MMINDIDVEKTIAQAKKLLEQEKDISEAFRTVLLVIFTLMQAMIEMLSGNKQKLFGKKSEKANKPPLPPEEDNTESTQVSSYTRRKAKKTTGRKIDTSELPRYVEQHDLSLLEQYCSCCNNQLSKIGEDVSEQLESVPMQLYVVEHRRSKYCCRNCESIVMAPKPEAPLPKALAGASLMAEVVVSKFQYHLPLYRQSKIFASFGIDLPDNTLGNWSMQSGKKLKTALSKVMWSEVLKVNYLQVDETPIKVQKHDKKSYLWTYYAPKSQSGLVMFEFSLTRSGKVAEDRLSEYKGVLQTDAYAGYNNLRKSNNITGCGCLTHARRMFSDVLKITKMKDGVASQFIEMVKPLYALEEKMRHLNLNHHTRKRLRQKQAWPIVKELHVWLKKQSLAVPPKSKIAKAISYTLSQWQYIIAYLRHGLAEIDTNLVENQIRPVAIGKKNWLFVNNEQSGEVNAFWYSLIQSAMLNGINPRTYIHYLLANLHRIRKNEVDKLSMLPHKVSRDALHEFEVAQLNLAKKVFDST